MIDEAQEKRLANWVRWCRSNPARAHCMSIEHRYKAPPCWEAPEPRFEVDILDAVLIEKAVIGLPAMYKAALKYGYVMPWVDYWVQIKRIGCKSNDYETTIHKAMVMVFNRIIKNA